MIPHLSPEQRLALDEHNDQPVYVIDAERNRTYVLVTEDAFQRARALIETVNIATPWSDELEARRCELIDKDIAGAITAEERAELMALDERANAHFDQVAPPPTNGARQLHQRLLRLNDDADTE